MKIKLKLRSKIQTRISQLVVAATCLSECDCLWGHSLTSSSLFSFCRSASPPAYCWASNSQCLLSKLPSCRLLALVFSSCCCRKEFLRRVSSRGLLSQLSVILPAVWSKGKPCRRGQNKHFCRLDQNRTKFAPQRGSPRQTRATGVLGFLDLVFWKLDASHARSNEKCKLQTNSVSDYWTFASAQKTHFLSHPEVFTAGFWSLAPMQGHAGDAQLTMEWGL